MVVNKSIKYIYIKNVYKITSSRCEYKVNTMNGLPILGELSKIIK